MILFLLSPKLCRAGVQEGLSLCAGAVIPALFPFSVLTPLLTHRACAWFSRAFPGGRQRMPALLLAYLIGMTAGFPMGAAALSRMYRSGMLDRDTASAAVGVCSGASPAFLVGYVGVGLFGSPWIGWCCLLIQLSVTLLVGLLILLYVGHTKETVYAVPHISPPTEDEALTLPSAIANGARTLLSVSGSVVFFSVIRRYMDVIGTALFGEGIPSLFLSGLWELTGAVSDAAGMSCPGAFIMTGFFIGLGGGAAALQTAEVLSGTSLSMKYYLPTRLLCGILFAACAAPLGR